MSRFHKLTDACRKLGYHGICPEALEELQDVTREMDVFMDGMRQMFAPAEDDLQVEILTLAPRRERGVTHD